MPARVFRNTVENTVQGHTMVLEAKSLCGGCWTPGGWEPPASIASGASGGWQSESCGIMTGTQGWVKYRLRRDSDSANRGLIYIYWTNPYLGVTRPRALIVGQNIVADCDENSAGAGSSFSDATGENARPSDLFLDLTGMTQDGNPSTGDNLLEWAAVVGNPLSLIGLQGIYQRMEVTYKLRSTSTPTLLPPPKPKTQTLETHPDPATFTGTWTGSSLSVTLSLIGGRRFRVRVFDHTQPTPFELDVETSLGVAGATIPLTELAAHLILQLAGHSEEKVETATVLASIAASMQLHGVQLAAMPAWKAAPEVAEGSVAMLSKPLTRALVKSHAQDLGIETFPGMDAVAAVVSDRSNEAEYMLHLGSGVALYLVRVLEGGEIIDYKLHYQRLAPDNSVIVDTDLSYLLHVN